MVGARNELLNVCRYRFTKFWPNRGAVRVVLLEAWRGRGESLYPYLAMGLKVGLWWASWAWLYGSWARSWCSAGAKNLVDCSCVVCETPPLHLLSRGWRDLRCTALAVPRNGTCDMSCWLLVLRNKCAGALCTKYVIFLYNFAKRWALFCLDFKNHKGSSSSHIVNTRKHLN